MKTPMKVVKKVACALLLLVLAALASLFIKEALDTQDPEAALPLIEVRCDGVLVPDTYRAAYQWNFFVTTEKREAQMIAVADMPLVPMDVQPSQAVNVAFSKTPQNLRVWRGEGRDTTSFTELSGISPESATTFYTPSTPGVYVYKVYGEWARGNVLYYFAVEVKN